MKKVITSHIHTRIKKLAQGAIGQGDILSCDRISDTSYLIKRWVDNSRPKTMKYTAVAAASLLYLLNSLANASDSHDPVQPDSDFSSDYSQPERHLGSQSEPDPEPESESEPEPDSDFNFDSEYLEPEPVSDLETETETETEFLETI
jgi:hypothetical protein